MRSLLILFMASCALSATHVPEDSWPATSNIMGAEYPRIHSDLRVTFRANAPGAQKVQLMPRGADNGLGKGPIDMAKDDKSVWTATTRPAVPGFHYYWFISRISDVAQGLVRFCVQTIP
jgi:1,4-alpha-glucan branching enzyme